MLEYLFICSAGAYRSPTAAEVAMDLARKAGIKRFKSDFFGIDTIYFNVSKRLNRADMIFVMENYMADRLIRHNHISPDKIRVLDIEDMYLKNDPELVRILRQKLEPFFRDL